MGYYCDIDIIWCEHSCECNTSLKLVCWIPGLHQVTNIFTTITVANTDVIVTVDVINNSGSQTQICRYKVVCTTISYIDIYPKFQHKCIIAIAITYAACNCGHANNSAHCMCRCIAYTTR